MKNELSFSIGGSMLLILGIHIPSSVQWVPWGQQPPLLIQQTALGIGQQPNGIQQVVAWGQQLILFLQQTAPGAGQQL